MILNVFTITATSFGKIFLRAPPGSKPVSPTKGRSPSMSEGEEDMKRSAFIYHFLSNEYDEWGPGRDQSLSTLNTEGILTFTQLPMCTII